MRRGIAAAQTRRSDIGHSPPHEPTSLPTSKAEPLPPGKEATSEAEKPKTETTPLAAIGGKRGRSGGGQPKKEKSPAGIPKSTPKLSPKIMRIVLNILRERPIHYLAALAAGIAKHLPEHVRDKQSWRHVAAELDKAAAGDDTAEASLALCMALSLEGVECRPK